MRLKSAVIFGLVVSFSTGIAPFLPANNAYKLYSSGFMQKISRLNFLITRNVIWRTRSRNKGFFCLPVCQLPRSLKARVQIVRIEE